MPPAGRFTLREAVDCEQPEDADKNNEYQVTIEATANNQVVEQNLEFILQMFLATKS